MKDVYLDNASTTCVINEVLTPMVDAMINNYGNPSSLHSKGLEAQKLFNKAGLQVMNTIGAKNGKVIFTSGATESNNLAILGGAMALKKRGNRVITTQIEHPSVASPFDELEKKGFDVIRIPPNADGIIDINKMENALTADTILVSVMAVNNETGAIQPFLEVARLVKRKSPLALIHCDAVQAFGKIRLKIEGSAIDLLSVSAHKIHGPKGVGALYIAPKARVLPLIFGGGQQGDIRPGTENLPLSVGLGQAAAVANEHLEENLIKISELNSHLRGQLEVIDGIEINSPQNSSPYILSLSLPGYRSETMLHFLESYAIYVSSGSACSKGAKSGVLGAMGKSAAVIDSTLRISFNRFNTTEEVDFFIETLKLGINTIRKSR